MSKIVWTYDPDTKVLIGNGRSVDDNYVVKAGETFAVPADGLLDPITFDGTNWQGEDIDIWLDKHNQKQPTAEQQLLMQQATDITSLKQTVMSQAVQIATLSKGSAE